MPGPHLEFWQPMVHLQPHPCSYPLPASSVQGGASSKHHLGAPNVLLQHNRPLAKDRGATAKFHSQNTESIDFS